MPKIGSEGAPAGRATFTIVTDGSVKAFVQQSLGCAAFEDSAIEVAIIEDGVIEVGIVYDQLGLDDENRRTAHMNIAKRRSNYALPPHYSDIFTHVYDTMGLYELEGLVIPADTNGRSFAQGLGATNRGQDNRYESRYERWSVTAADNPHYRA